MLSIQRSATISNCFSKFKRLPAISQPLSSSSSSLLRLCRSTKLLNQIHSRFIIHGLNQNPSLAADLLACYSDLSCPDLSVKVFESIEKPNLFLYRALLRTLFRDGEAILETYCRMAAMSLFPDECTYLFVIRACLSVLVGSQVHGHLIKFGFDSFCIVGNALIEMYWNSWEIRDARVVFETMPSRNLASWNLIVLAFGEFGDARESFGMFKRMRIEGFQPDSVTFIGLLRLCVDLDFLELGRLLHSLVIMNNLSGDLSVSTSILTMYCKLGSLEMARQLFDRIEQKDCAVWNVLMSGYSKNVYPILALELLEDMVKSGVRTDLFTAIASIASVSELKSLRYGKEIHGHVIRNGSDYQVSVYNSLIEMYFKCRCPESAKKLFNSLRNKSAISWSLMIKGYLSNDYTSEALLVFNEMKMAGIKPDRIALINVLPACVSSGALEQAKSIHGCSIKHGLSSHVSVITALLVSYAKCGCIEMARKLFNNEEAAGQDLISWNSMIGAYSKHGNWNQCFKLYEQMKDLSIKPDSITFLELLTACVNSGLVSKGEKCFNEMIDVYGYEPDQEHYACMVDLLGRSGQLDEAKTLIEKMPFKPDARVWGPLLSACKLHSDSVLGEFTAEKLIEMEPQNAGNYVLLSNIYAAAGKWDCVARMRGFLRGGGLKKTPGISWLDVNGSVHEFRVFDQSHPASEDIHTMLKVLELEIKPCNNLQC